MKKIKSLFTGRDEKGLQIIYHIVMILLCIIFIAPLILVVAVSVSSEDSAAISPFCGFSVDTKSIRTELSQLETVISAHSFVNVGAADPATYYDDFIKKIKAAGSDKIVEEYEKQIAEFLAANGK